MSAYDDEASELWDDIKTILSTVDGYGDEKVLIKAIAAYLDDFAEAVIESQEPIDIG